MKEKRMKQATAQKQECSSPSLQPSLRCYTLAFLATRLLLLWFICIDTFGQEPIIKEPQPANLIPQAKIGLNNPNNILPSPQVYNPNLTIEQRNQMIIEEDLHRGEQQQQQQQQIIDDANNTFYGNFDGFSFPSHEGLRGTEAYKKALNEFEKMLSGKEPLSIKRAEFIKENAYYENTLSYDNYCKIIDNVSYLCGLQMKKDKLPNTDLAKNLTIYKFMADTIAINLPNQEKKFTHYPMRYDFNDNWGDTIWENTFVTKLLMTQTGQCLSLPRLFMIISEELGSKAYLALSPNHSYIKIPIGKNKWQNIELTSGLLTSDAFIIKSGFVKSASIENKIYMDTLNKKEIVATSLFEMANGYLHKYGYDNFYIMCVDLGLKYHPNNIVGLINKSNYYNALLMYTVKNNPNIDKKNISQYPQAYDTYLRADSAFYYLREVGYEKIPRDIYEEWRKSASVEESVKSCNTIQQSLRSIK